MLVSIVVTSASEDNIARPKRDLAFFKNLISAKLLGVDEAASEAPKILVKQPENYRLFRIPGFDKILVKAIPKVPGAETSTSNTIVEESESSVAANESEIAIVNSYLGTKQLNETLLALQGVKDLLQSGVLDTQRELVAPVKTGSYPSVVVESGKVIVDGVPVKESIPIPVIEGYRPVEVTRLPDLPLPTKYSYKQINNGGVMSYTASDNQKVIVSESHRPVPLPPYVTYRLQEALSLGTTYRRPMAPVVPVVATAVKLPPPPVPVYNIPRVHVITPPVKVMPSYASSGYSLHQTHIPSRPVKLAASNAPGSFSYQQIHNDGGVTSYSGSGQVIERKGERPVVVITETLRPAPLPVFLTNRIEKVAATAMAAKIPSVPHALYDAPVVYREPYPVVIDETPTYVYDHVRSLPPSLMNPWHRPFYRDVNVNIIKHKNQRPIVPSNGPSGYSYKTVHADDSASTYTDSGLIEEGHKGFEPDGVKFIPTRYPEAYGYQNVYQPHIVEEEICLEPPSVNSPHTQTLQPTPGGYSYKTVHGDGLSTTYTGSGHVEHLKVPETQYLPMANQPPIMVPEMVSPAEFFKGDSESPQKVMFAQPVVSQYVYKQINHNDPNSSTVPNVGLMPVNGEVNVNVGSISASNDTPYPFVNPTPKGPSEYVFVPPLDVNEPLPTKKPVEANSEAQTGNTFTHVTKEGIHTNKDGTASFESATSSPVVEVVKTSSSTSSSKRPYSPKKKVVRVRANSRVRVTTTAAPTTTKEPISLSANPIVVLPEEEKTFSFKQDRADGSSITVVGSKDNVAVIEKNRSDEHRGDIPSTSY